MTPSSARHKRGCNCKKSMCLKKYCECYQVLYFTTFLCTTPVMFLLHCILVAQSIFIALKRLMLAAPVDVVVRDVKMSTAGRKVGI